MTGIQKKFLDVIDEYGYDIFSVDMIRATHRLSEGDLYQAIKSLSKSQTIVRLERGKYVKYGFYDPNVIASFLVADGGVGYWTALNAHGLTEQFANVTFAQTAKRKPEEKIILNSRFRFVKIHPRKLFGYDEFGSGNHKYRMTNVEKTILDCFELPHHSGWYQEIIKAFYKAEIDEQKLIEYCAIINNRSVSKRLGYLVELLQKTKMNRFMAFAQKSVGRGYSLFEIDGEIKGNYEARWKLIINMDPEEILEIAHS